MPTGGRSSTAGGSEELDGPLAPDVDLPASFSSASDLPRLPSDPGVASGGGIGLDPCSQPTSLYPSGMRRP